MPEEIVRINFGLHMNQPVEVILEVLGAKSTCLFNACAPVLVHSQIKIPVIDICFPWRLGDIRRQELVNLPRPIYMVRNIFFGILPP